MNGFYGGFQPAHVQINGGLDLILAQEGEYAGDDVVMGDKVLLGYFMNLGKVLDAAVILVDVVGNGVFHQCVFGLVHTKLGCFPK